MPSSMCSDSLANLSHWRKLLKWLQYFCCGPPNIGEHRKMYEEELSKAMEPLEHMWLGMEERPTMLDKCKRWLRSRVRGPPSSTMEFQSRFGAQLFQAVLPIQRIQVQMATQAPRTGPPVFKPQPWYGYLKKELLGVVGLEPHHELVQIIGQQGMGKSTLAYSLARELERTGWFTGGTYYISGANTEDGNVEDISMALLKSFALRLGYESLYKGNPTASQLSNEINKLFSGPLEGTWHLLVLPDIPNAGVLEQLTFPSMAGVILFTSEADFAQPGVRMVNLLPVDTATPAQELLMDILGSSLTTEQQDIVQRVLEDCDGNMSMVGNIGNALKNSPSVDLWADITVQVRAAPKPAVKAIELNVQQLKESSDPSLQQAWKAFDLLRLLDMSKPVPLQLLNWLWAFVYDESGSSVVQMNKQAFLSLLKLREVQCAWQELQPAWSVAASAQPPEKVLVYQASRLVQQVLVEDDATCKLPGEDLEKLPEEQLADSIISRLAAVLLLYGRERVQKWAARQLQATPKAAVGIAAALAQQSDMSSGTLPTAAAIINLLSRQLE